MIEKIFVNDTYKKVMGNIAHFIEEYKLMLVKCEIEMIEENVYQGKIKYKLGLRDEHNL